MNGIRWTETDTRRIYFFVRDNSSCFMLEWQFKKFRFVFLSSCRSFIYYHFNCRRTMTVDKLIKIKNLSGQTISKKMFWFIVNAQAFLTLTIKRKLRRKMSNIDILAWTYSQNIQKNFLIAVTLIHSFFLAKSPIAPKMKPAMNRAKYGKLARIPAWDNLKPRTFKANCDELNVNQWKNKTLTYLTHEFWGRC